MKKIGLVLSVMLLSGCAAQEHHVTSADPDVLFIGKEKPSGFPRESIVRDGHTCVHQREDWIKSDYQGQTIWLKNDDLQTVGCPDA